MEKDNSKTNVGAWINGIIKLKNTGFEEREISDLNIEISTLISYLLRYYNEGDELSNNIVKDAIEETFDKIIDLKKAGFEFDDINNLMDDIKSAYSFVEEEYDDEDIFRGFNDDDGDDEDGDDDEGDDDDDGFDPRKFFPRK